MKSHFLLITTCLSSLFAAASFASTASAAEPLKLAVFQCDATPPVGSALCDGLVVPVEKVDDPLDVHGVVLLGAGEPIVLVAVDWVGIGNGGQEAWKQGLAKAAGTLPERVAVHCLHQHDAPGCDFTTEELLAQHNLAGAQFNVGFARETIERAAAALKASLGKAKPVTHVGVGQAAVVQVASNRRIVQADGKVGKMRASSCKDADLIAAPEGLIDPLVRIVSFWDGEQPIAALSYYATHPQSHYGKGAVSADFVGLARRKVAKEFPEAAWLHFNGAGGNVAAGKYNDGSPERRPELAGRLAAGMSEAWKATKRQPLSPGDVAWRAATAVMPPRKSLNEEALLTSIKNGALTPRDRVRAARDLTWLKRCQAGGKVDFSALRLGDSWIVHLPGESFIEFQLAAQAERPKQFVAVAAYGDYGPGYIGTSIAYEQGGYETSPVSRVAPEVEQVMRKTIAELLR